MREQSRRTFSNILLGAPIVRQGLIACITCELLALAIWIGGLVVLVAAVIPAVFNTFGGQDTGGFFLTSAFDGYNRLVLGASTVLTLGVLWRAWLVQQGLVDGEISRTEWLLLGGMLLAAGVITFVLHPQAAALQAQLSPPRVRKREKRPSKRSFRCTNRCGFCISSMWDSASHC